MIGSRVGPYEITAKLGQGGMGEVWRATDSKLRREVAIKVLPAAFVADPDRLVRFEREAQLLAQLNHPHIAQIYGMESSGDSHALVMELVEGPTLAERLESGSLPIEESLSLATQIAEALEEAHEKGIIHRDLKPLNIKAPGEGKVKILDFGLAKAMAPDPGSAGSPPELTQSPTETFHGTRAGVILGTAAYMAPEQAQGGRVDKRADIWAFGVVLYEMLTGERLFAGGSVVDTLSAVMRQEIDLGKLPEGLPRRLQELVRRCLERDPKLRLRDIGEARIALGEPGVAGEPVPTPPSPPPAGRRRIALPIAALCGALLAVAVTALLLEHAGGVASPDFRRLTFQRGTITAARFAPDPDTVVYSAAWGGRPSEVFTTRRSGPGSRPLGLVDASLVAVSRQGELAVKLHPRLWANLFHGTLGRVPLAGGAPREVIDSVEEADWSPEGKGLVVLRMESGAARWIVEDAAGKVLYQESDISLSGLRISPDGQRVAVLRQSFGSPSSMLILDPDGQRRVLPEARATGLAWSPSGEEIWYSQQDASGASSLWAVDLEGRRRVLLRHAGSLTLRDVSGDGALLVSVDHLERSVYYHGAASAGERDLAWLDGTDARDISPDGGTLLLAEVGAAGGPEGAVYLRDTDGSPAVRLGEGQALALSPDGEWALVSLGDPRRLLLVPTGVGQALTIPLPKPVEQAWFFPDGSRLLVNLSLPNGRTRLVSIDRNGGRLRQVAPDGFDNFIGENPLSPDGKWLDAQSPGAGQSTKLELFPTDGSLRAREVPGFEPDDAVIRWAGDSRALFVFKRNELPARVFRLDLATGARTPWLELMPADPAGVTRIRTVFMTPDGRSYAYNVARQLSDLYLVQGIH